MGSRSSALKHNVPADCSEINRRHASAMCKEVQVYLAQELADLVVAFALLPMGDDDAHSQSYHLGPFVCPTATKRVGRDVAGKWDPSTMTCAVMRDTVFVSGTCLQCDEAHIVRRDLRASSEWTVSKTLPGRGATWLCANIDTQILLWVEVNGLAICLDLQGVEASALDLGSWYAAQLVGVAFAGQDLILVRSQRLDFKNWVLDVARWKLPSAGKSAQKSWFSRGLARHSLVVPSAGLLRRLSHVHLHRTGRRWRGSLR